MDRKNIYLLWMCGVFILLALGSAAFLAGWELFFFETDDAYIAYRYVANSFRGWGFVYNPPPFRPVEGYTSFLWVLLLRGVWSLLGAEPPQATFYLNPLFGYGSLLLAVCFILRMRLWRRMGSAWLLILALVLCGLLANRTFLAWLSSGLEASLFNFLFTWWVFEAFTPPRRRSSGWIMRYSTAAALAALTRPDGLLMVAGTGLILALLWLRGRLFSARGLVWSFPLLAIPAHLIWRRVTYGDWLPNTYYAKHLGAWPEAGWRYLTSFVLENGVWVWVIIAAAWGMGKIREAAPRRYLPEGLLTPGGVAVAVLAAHTGYYTFIIGGDHFEYRVYSHLIPLLFVSAAWMTTRSGSGLKAIAALTCFVLASLPIGWVHWQESQGFSTRKETVALTRPIAGRFPAALSPIIGRWDKLQRWLISHSVCVRHQEHKMFFIYQSTRGNTPPTALEKEWNHRHIMVKICIGVPGWKNLNYVMIDEAGLTDRVIGRKPIKRAAHARKMAHDRAVISEYINCFRVKPQAGEHKEIPPAREVPLTDDEIRSCESRKWY